MTSTTTKLLDEQYHLIKEGFLAHSFYWVGQLSTKVIVQQLVKHYTEWDTPVPKVIEFRWLEFREDIKPLKELPIPWHVFVDTSP